MTIRPPLTGPLRGIRILDLTRLLHGPLGTMLMADMGAEVIKIENPQQLDTVRAFGPYVGGESIHYLSANRSKRSLCLDYSLPEGQAVFWELVKTADLVVEQFRPGFLSKVGLGYEVAKAVNPRIIYVSVTGYGQTGPYAPLAGHDLNYLGYSGVLDLTGEADETPQIPGVPLADIAGGSYMAVVGALAALHSRSQTGCGQHVDVSMTDGVMPLLNVPFAYYAATGQILPRGEWPLSGGLPNYEVYRCEDGRYVALGALEPKFWYKFCDLVEKPAWKRYLQPKDSYEQLLFKKEITGLFMTHPQQHWAEFGRQHDLPLTPMRQLDELEHDPHLQARRMIVEQEHPRAGRIKGIGVPLKFSQTSATPAWPAPALGEDTFAILRELGWTEDRIQALADKGILGKSG